MLKVIQLFCDDYKYMEVTQVQLKFPHPLSSFSSLAFKTIQTAKSFELEALRPTMLPVLGAYRLIVVINHKSHDEFISF